MEKGEFLSFDEKGIEFYNFTPKEKKEKYPAMIYYHGGGFMFPIQKFMMNNRVRYCERLGIKVFLPEYRISLEDSCDTIIEDCYYMLEYVFENAERLGVDKGKSAGVRRQCGRMPGRERYSFKQGQEELLPVWSNAGVSGL